MRTDNRFDLKLKKPYTKLISQNFEVTIVEIFSIWNNGNYFDWRIQCPKQFWASTRF